MKQYIKPQIKIYHTRRHDLIATSGEPNKVYDKEANSTVGAGANSRGSAIWD